MMKGANTTETFQSEAVQHPDVHIPESEENENITLGFSIRVFMAILKRDIVVSMRQVIQFLLMVLIQPLFFLYVFGKILPTIGLAVDQYSAFLAPGIIALTAFLAGMQTTAFQVGSEFGWTREIEDRLLAPVSTALVGFQKIVFGALQSMIAAVVVTLLSVWILGAWYEDVTWSWPMIITMTILTGFSSSSLGVAVGTLVNEKNVGTIFGLVLTPIIFLGGPFYPWALLDEFMTLKIISLLNPLLYISEGFQYAFAREFPHMELHYIFIGIGATILLFSLLGIRGFIKRAQE